MRKQYIKGSNNKPFEIIEDDQNNQSNLRAGQRPKLHRYEVQLDKLSKATKETLIESK